MKTYDYWSKPPVENASTVEQQLIRSFRFNNIAIELLRKKIIADEAAQGDETEILRIKEAYNSSLSKERKNSGLYWGSYLLIEKAVTAASQSEGLPRFKDKFDGSGRLGVQIQHGMTVAELTEGKDRRARLIGEGKYRKLYFRVGTETNTNCKTNGKPVWAVFPILYHRDLPPLSIIKYITLLCRRVGSRLIYHVQFSIGGSIPSSIPAPTKGTVAINFGWRQFGPDQIRIASWKDNEGESGEIRIESSIVRACKKVQDLKSIRSKNFNEIISYIKENRPSFPAWLQKEVKHCYNWKVQDKLLGVVWRFRNNRSTGDEAVYGKLEEWRKQDKHLSEWEVNQRKNIINAKLYQYRGIGIEVARYNRVIIDDLDLRALIELPKTKADRTNSEPVIEDPRTTAARGRRFIVALSILRSCINSAVKSAGGTVEKANPAWKTQTCYKCLNIEIFDAAGSVEHTCSHCGTSWDQDVNHAANLLRESFGCPSPAKPSLSEVSGTTGESKTQMRRRKGLEAKRLRRSQEAEEKQQNQDVELSAL